VTEKPEAVTETKSSVPPQIAEKLFRGEMNLAQVVGMTPHMQYQVAALAHQLVQSGHLERKVIRIFGEQKKTVWR